MSERVFVGPRIPLRFRGGDGLPVETGAVSGRKPAWLKVPMPGSEGYMRMRALLEREGLNTICVSGKCPNATECFTRGTATFMLMGHRCTRTCGYCDVEAGPPLALDADEPRRIAEAAAGLGLKFVVVTSVTRDDLPDGGAAHFAATIRSIKADGSGRRVEVLTPDFFGGRRRSTSCSTPSPTCSRTTSRPAGASTRSRAPGHAMTARWSCSRGPGPLPARTA